MAEIDIEPLQSPVADTARQPAKPVLARWFGRFGQTLNDVIALVISRIDSSSYRSTGRRMPWGRWAVLAAVLISFAYFVLDEALAQHHFAWDSAIVAIAQRITHLGKSDWILIPLGAGLITAGFLPWRKMDRHALALWINRVQLAWFVFLAVGLPGLIATIFKQSIGRARPTLYETEGLWSFDPWTMGYDFASFPSGHSTTAAAFFIALAVLMPKLRYLAFFFILWIAGSRVIIGVHHPSDIVAGIMLGAWFALFVAVAFARNKLLFRFNEEGRIRLKKGFRLTRWREEARLWRFVQKIPPRPAGTARSVRFP